MDEFEIIDKYFRPLAKGCEQASNLQDDVAEISIPDDYKLVVSKDLIVEDVHFKRSYGAYNIASKLLRANLSDLASSGAKPLYYMLGFSKSLAIDEKFIADFCEGLKETADQYDICLIGGDSVATKDKLFFSLTIFGQVKKEQSLNRNQAKSRDLIFVTGYIGDAFLGLKITQNQLKSFNQEDKNYLLLRHYKPTPRVELGQKLLEANLANAAIDISDGFLADLNHICQASNLSANINQNQIPISAQAKLVLKNNDISITDLLCGGDDYELIFTASKENKEEIINLSKTIDIPITCVGYLSDIENNKKRIRVIDDYGKELKISKYGYKHY